MLGPPGAGKSMLARRLTTILPVMPLAKAIETKRIYRAAGLTGDRTALVTTRPFRATPHTISDVGLIRGGQVPLPGEVSLAHNGVLFLDELPEFRRHVLEVLRQPLEKSIVYIQSPARHRPRRAGCDRRAAHDTNQIAGTMVVPDKVRSPTAAPGSKTPVDRQAQRPYTRGHRPCCGSSPAPCWGLATTREPADDSPHAGRFLYARHALSLVAGPVCYKAPTPDSLVSLSQRGEASL
jgi:hypothetical protein